VQTFNAHTYVQTHTHIYVHTFLAHTNTHTHTHTRTHTQRLPPHTLPPPFPGTTTTGPTTLSVSAPSSDAHSFAFSVNGEAPPEGQQHFMGGSLNLPLAEQAGNERAGPPQGGNHYGGKSSAFETPPSSQSAATRPSTAVTTPALPLSRSVPTGIIPGMPGADLDAYKRQLAEMQAQLLGS
jgi:hypothetical protein